MKRVLATAIALAVAGCGGSHGNPGTDPAKNAVRIVATQAREVRGDYSLYHTERGLNPPVVTVHMGPADGTSPGSIFLTPRAPNPKKASGPTILDSNGRLLWFLPRPGRVTSDLVAQKFKGRPVLTWGERDPVVNPDAIFRADFKNLYFVMVDRRYKEILKLRAIGDDVGTDMHEMVITPRNTALIIGFKLYRRDLSDVGQDRVGEIVDGVVQEIDLTTGKLLLNWSALTHIPLKESMFPLPYPESPNAWDAYHPNSVSVASDGNLLVSMRHTSAIYKINRKTGAIIWKLGGKDSDFKMGKGADFLYQHDAQSLGKGRYTVFDNGATFTDQRKDHSSVKILQLDEAKRTATLVKDIVHEPAVTAVSQGNSRVLPNGDIFVGWGNREYFSEYTPQGQQLFDASVPSNAFQSYRAFKGAWSGRPTTRPKVVADTLRGRTLVWASWNGATDVASWRVLGGPTATTLKPLGVGKRVGFETRLDVAAERPVIRVEALDRNGKVLGRSALVRP